MRDNVTLHPKTVVKGEKLAKEATRRRRKSDTKTPEPEVQRRYKKRPEWLNPLVWNEAVRISGGNHKRIIVNSPTEVKVVNRES